MSAPSHAFRSTTVSSRLLRWFDRHRRDLPWRQSKDAYRVWLSEIMLQQTQVATVIPYFNRFLARFPTVRHLARARLDDVLRLWAGLGYYARGRNLHAAARMVVHEFGGKFPRSAAELQRLPGVGRYTAGAIASIAFGERAPIVDGNVARVLSRLFDLRSDIASKEGQTKLWHTAERLLPSRRCGDFNEAIMELGALVCLPGTAARCDACPLRGLCLAHLRSRVGQLPIKRRAAKPTAETYVVAAIRGPEGWLMVRRPAGGLWGGLWELPTVRFKGMDTAEAARRLAVRLLGLRWAVQSEPFCDVTRRLTHRKIRFVGHVCRPRSRSTGKKATENARWAPVNRAMRMGCSTAMRRVLASLSAIVE